MPHGVLEARQQLRRRGRRGIRDRTAIDEEIGDDGNGVAGRATGKTTAESFSSFLEIAASSSISETPFRATASRSVAASCRSHWRRSGCAALSLRIGGGGAVHGISFLLAGTVS